MADILTRGATGRAVSDMQQLLAAAGFQAPRNGVYDDATVQAVRSAQARGGLVQDGIFGPKTRAYLAGANTGRLLQEQDLLRAADTLGVPLAAIKAVNSVESRGSGFLPDGRAVILFERHVFWEQLHSAGIDPAILAAPVSVLSRERGGYAGGAAEYARLAIARRIHEGAALASASWGLFQIMGYHWENLGYASVTEFVERQQSSEGAQLDAFVRFLQVNGALLTALRGQKWTAFARGYNGADYASNLYDVKLAREFARFSTMHGEEVAA
jgi:hypothetical protein